MANMVNVNFKLDADVKRGMEEVCSEIGITMSAAFTIFAKKVVRERKIPFDLTANPLPSGTTEQTIEKATSSTKY